MVVEAYSDDVWYFAYGSNLDIDQKQSRTGNIREARLCRLPRYRLAFNKRGSGGQVFANIVADDTKEVWGVAYRCRPHTLETMDTFEGAGRGHYTRVPVGVLTEAGETLQAITYIAATAHVGAEDQPTLEYVTRILKGARQHGLPEDYIDRIEKLAGGGNG